MWRLLIVALIACKKPVAEPAPAVATPAPDAAPDAAIADAPHASAAAADAPAVLIGRIIKAQVVGGQTVLTVLLGTDQGVEQGWGGCVLDVRDACIEDPSFVVVKAEPTRSLVRSASTMAPITQSGRVKLHPK